MSDQVIEINVDIKPIGPVKKLYGGRVVKFMAEMPSGISPFQIWFPVYDRRVARRIARREGMRFSKVDGSYAFRR